MKEETGILFFLRLTLTLLLITAVVAAALAGVNAITGPIIADINANKTQEAISEVLPGGGQLLDAFPDKTGLVQAVYASDTGYAVEVAPVGFNGEIVMMVGVVDGKVSKISIISQAETPSLGAESASGNAKGQAFRAQFSGLSGEVAVKKDGGTVDALTSATVTSRAIAEGVNAALACAAALG